MSGRIVAVVQFLDALDDLCQQRVDVLETGLVAGAGFGDREHLRLPPRRAALSARGRGGFSALAAISSPAVTSWRSTARSRTISARSA